MDTSSVYVVRWLFKKSLKIPKG